VREIVHKHILEELNKKHKHMAYSIIAHSSHNCMEFQVIPITLHLLIKMPLDFLNAIEATFCIVLFLGRYTCVGNPNL